MCWARTRLNWSSIVTELSDSWEPLVPAPKSETPGSGAQNWEPLVPAPGSEETPGSGAENCTLYLVPAPTAPVLHELLVGYESSEGTVERIEPVSSTGGCCIVYESGDRQPYNKYGIVPFFGPQNPALTYYEVDDVQPDAPDVQPDSFQASKAMVVKVPASEIGPLLLGCYFEYADDEGGRAGARLDGYEITAECATLYTPLGGRMELQPTDGLTFIIEEGKK